MKTQKVVGQQSWRIATDEVELFVTRTGGHIAPVNFKVGGRTIQPFLVAPWAEQRLPGEIPSILRVLRGDFFCMPFGDDRSERFQGEQHPLHGEPSNANWRLKGVQEQGDHVQLQMSLATKVRPGRVDRTLRLQRGHRAVYQHHRISKMSGPMTMGHHPTLLFPDREGSGRISTSGFEFGQVPPNPVGQPEQGSYSILKNGEFFSSLNDVPMITGQTADLSRYPARRGYEDLVMLATRPAEPFAWTAATFPQERWVWFSLKNPRVLPSTHFWMSNGGRHQPPWNGRNINVMGLEEICAYFDYGLSGSAAPNPWRERGWPTTVELDPKRPLDVRFVMAVAEVPEDFDMVREIRPDDGSVTLLAESGARVQVPLDWSFVRGEGR